MILDLFAGPGGFSEGCRILGLLGEAGIELDRWACATRRAAGHATVRADVAAFPVRQLRGRVTGLIASPPCGGVSIIGGRRGLADLPLVTDLLAEIAAGADPRAAYAGKMADYRSVLMAEPLRYALAAMPEWIALEQVPAVLPVWQATAQHLRAAGYSATAGVLDAGDYGVPQNRRRAVLVASRARSVRLPAPTHYDPRKGAQLWREPAPSMADALGWGYRDRPAPTVTGGGTATGGAEPFGNGTRQAMRAAMEDPARWVPRPGGGYARSHVAVSAADCAVLQSFRPGYPFQGNKGQVALQIGNAVPPRLAAAVIGAAAGIDWRLPVEREYTTGPRTPRGRLVLHITPVDGAW